MAAAASLRRRWASQPRFLDFRHGGFIEVGATVTMTAGDSVGADLAAQPPQRTGRRDLKIYELVKSA